VKYRILLAAVVCLCCMPAAAQNFQGGVRGRVHDVNGIVRAAAIELIEESTRLSRAGVSNDVGEYAFTNVLPGSYTIRAAAPGYKTFERTGLRVGTQTFLTIDVGLDVGSISETVIVRGETPRLDTSTASVGTLLTRSTLDALPSAGRNVFYTAGITATVVPTGDSRFVRQQDQSNSSLISLGGGPRRNNTYVVDGVPIVDILNRATFIPSFHAIEEMRVQLAAYDAEVGRTSGGVFNAIGRSGTNTSGIARRSYSIDLTGRRHGRSLR
jgi:trimeric autotransporter adhesin